MKPGNKQILDKIDILNGNGAAQEKANKSDFDSHLADNTKHLPSGGIVGQIVQKQSSGWGLADLPPSKDVDNGRYQTNWGLDDATFSGTALSNGIISLDTPSTSTINFVIANSMTDVQTKNGLMILPKATITGLVVTKHPLVTSTMGYIINNSTNEIIATTTFVGNVATFTGLSLLSGTNYRVVTDYGSNYNTPYRISTTYPVTSTYFDVTSGITNNTVLDNSYAYNITSIVATSIIHNMSGTVTKTVTP